VNDGVSIVVVTHNPYAANFADTTFHMSDEKLSWRQTNRINFILL